jgi:hypothetical protein
MKQYLAISPNILPSDCIIFNASDFKHAKKILKLRIKSSTVLTEVKLIELNSAIEKNYFIK